VPTFCDGRRTIARWFRRKAIALSGAIALLTIVVLSAVKTCLHGVNVYESVTLPCNHGLAAAASGRGSSNEAAPPPHALTRRFELSTSGADHVRTKRFAVQSRP
jgi:hypothetical protein